MGILLFHMADAQITAILPSMVYQVILMFLFIPILGLVIILPAEIMELLIQGILRMSAILQEKIIVLLFLDLPCTMKQMIMIITTGMTIGTAVSTMAL